STAHEAAASPNRPAPSDPPACTADAEPDGAAPPPDAAVRDLHRVPVRGWTASQHSQNPANDHQRDRLNHHTTEPARRHLPRPEPSPRRGTPHAAGDPAGAAFAFANSLATFCACWVPTIPTCQPHVPTSRTAEAGPA